MAILFKKSIALTFLIMFLSIIMSSCGSSSHGAISTIAETSTKANKQDSTVDITPMTSPRTNPQGQQDSPVPETSPKTNQQSQEGSAINKDNKGNPGYSDIDWNSINSNMARADEESDWIKSTIPKQGATVVPPELGIVINFKQAMDPKSLNQYTILVLDGKHGDRIMSQVFKFEYLAKSKTLNMIFKVSSSSHYGSGNGITVIITNKIRNTSQQSPDKNYAFGFNP